MDAHPSWDDFWWIMTVLGMVIMVMGLMGAWLFGKSKIDAEREVSKAQCDAALNLLNNYIGLEASEQESTWVTPAYEETERYIASVDRILGNVPQVDDPLQRVGVAPGSHA